MSNSFTGKVAFSPSFAPRPSIKHVLLDFDGTLSLIREGWPEVMLGMFLEMLPRRAGAEGTSQPCHRELLPRPASEARGEGWGEGLKRGGRQRQGRLPGLETSSPRTLPL